MTPGDFMPRIALTALLALAALCRPVSAQVLRGVVLDGTDERSVAGALVGIETRDGDRAGFAIADSMGRYSLETPGPGAYRIVAEAPGYHRFRSLLLDIASSSHVIDVELERAPLPLPGLVVTAERFAEIERGLRLVLGMHPRSLRFEPVMRPEIERYLERGYALQDVIRWSGVAGVVTRRTDEGWCFQWRGRHCLPVYLNGVRVRPEHVSVLSLEMVEVLVVLAPGETPEYMGGAVLLYTAGWIG